MKKTRKEEMKIEEERRRRTKLAATEELPPVNKPLGPVPKINKIINI